MTGDIPEGYEAPAGTTLLKGSKYTVEDVPQNVSGTKDGVRGTYSFTGWKDADGSFVTELEHCTVEAQRRSSPLQAGQHRRDPR